MPLAAIVITFCAPFYLYVFYNLPAYLVPPTQAERLSILGRINLSRSLRPSSGAGILPSEVAPRTGFLFTLSDSIGVLCHVHSKA